MDIGTKNPRRRLGEILDRVAHGARVEGGGTLMQPSVEALPI